jgi:uncharacterized protein YqhQ
MPDQASEREKGLKDLEIPERRDAGIVKSEALISGDVLVGGQAVIEGVMMRTPNAYAVSVRLQNGTIVREGRAVAKFSSCWPILNKPVLRGVSTLAQSLVLGIRTLNYSASVLAAEEDPQGKAGQGLSAWMLAVTLIFSALIGAGLFIFLPLFLADLLRGAVPIFKNWVLFNLADGLFRLVIFVAYIGAMVLSRDIRRVFEYHGAEHKVVYSWENKKELTPENAAIFSRLHPRCGTSFLLVVMSVSIVVFSIFKFSSFWMLAASRMLLMPLIAGLSYELIRWSSRQDRNSKVFMAFKLGLLLQRMTTREPDAGQLEVAIDALKFAMEIEKGLEMGTVKEAAA